MYVIFPLDDLLDLNSAKDSKRETAPSSNQSDQRPTGEGLPPSPPNQQLPNQLPAPSTQQPPLSRAPSTQQLPLSRQPTPTPPHKQPQQQPPKQKPPPKTPSKSSTSQAPTSSPVLASVHSSSSSSSHTGSLKKQKQNQPPTPESGNHRQGSSSHSASPETSSLSSASVKTRVLLSPVSTGGSGNRSSWSGTPSGGLLESAVSRSGSFKTRRDLALAAESVTGDSNVKVRRGYSVPEGVASDSVVNSVRDKRGSDSPQDGRPGATKQELKPHPTVAKSASFRSRLGPGGVGQQANLPPFNPRPATPAPHSRQSSASDEVQQPVAAAAAPQQQQQQQPGGLAAPQHCGGAVDHQLSSEECLKIQQDCLPQVRGSVKGGEGGGVVSGRGLGGPRASGANVKSPGGAGAPRGPHRTAMAGEVSLRDLTHPSANEPLKAHNSATFKLIKTDEGSTPSEPTGTSSHH